MQTASRLIAVLVFAAAALPAFAQYKVIGPDGKVSYTDRPPAADAGRSKPIAISTTPAAADAALPFDLRQPVAQYPVTLYTSGECQPCDAGRAWLRERGIPFTEKLVASPQEASQMARTLGSSDLPALSIGSQALRGYEPGEWASYLDAAGYPRSSQLPRSYRYAAASRLIAPPAAVASEPAPAAAPPVVPAPAPAATPDNPAGIKF